MHRAVFQKTWIFHVTSMFNFNFKDLLSKYKCHRNVLWLRQWKSLTMNKCRISLVKGNIRIHCCCFLRKNVSSAREKYILHSTGTTLWTYLKYTYIYLIGLNQYACYSKCTCGWWTCLMEVTRYKGCLVSIDGSTLSSKATL